MPLASSEIEILLVILNTLVIHKFDLFGGGSGTKYVVEGLIETTNMPLRLLNVKYLDTIE